MAKRLSKSMMVESYKKKFCREATNSSIEIIHFHQSKIRSQGRRKKKINLVSKVNSLPHPTIILVRLPNTNIKSQSQQQLSKNMNLHHNIKLRINLTKKVNLLQLQILKNINLPLHPQDTLNTYQNILPMKSKYLLIYFYSFVCKH